MRTYKTINEGIDLLYYFGNVLLVRKNERFHILNSIEKVIFEDVIKGFSLDQILTDLIIRLKPGEDHKALAEALDSYFESRTGLDMYSDSITQQRLSLPTIGVEGEYYPKYLQIELTKKCNLKCPHCYKEANEKDSKNISTQLLYDLNELLGSNMLTIGLTGGEPLLHPDFESISQTFAQKARLELNSNGVLINELDLSVIKLFSTMSISLYGVSEDEYNRNTNSNNSFRHLLLSGQKLKQSKVRFNASVIVTEDKITRLEDFVLLAIELGASTLQFGTANTIGRGSELSKSNQSWFLSLEKKREVYRNTRYLTKKYASQITIIEWNRDQYEKELAFGLSKIYANRSLACGGGTTDWAISEKMMFRPCVICPEISCLSLSYDEWKKYIHGEYIINWRESALELQLYCKQKGLCLNDYCNRFEDLIESTEVNKK